MAGLTSILRGSIWLRAKTALGKLCGFTRLEHSLFSLPLLFAGAWLGWSGGFPPWSVLGLIAAAGIGARTFGMALNRIFDRDIDALNKRTAGRELPSGRMTTASAYAVAGIGLLVYLSACTGLGRVCLYLAPIPLIPLTAYSLLKRRTNLCHFGIGLCLAIAPLGGFVAASGSIDAGMDILLLAFFTFCWISGFDIIYSLQDIESDRETGVHSFAVTLGAGGAQIAAAIVHLAAAAAIAALWWSMGRGFLSGVALIVTVSALAAGYLQHIPLRARFFPTSAIAGIAGALVPILGGY